MSEKRAEPKDKRWPKCLAFTISQEKGCQVVASPQTPVKTTIEAIDIIRLLLDI